MALPQPIVSYVGEPRPPARTHPSSYQGGMVMRARIFAGATLLGLAVAGAGLAQAAGQPPLRSNAVPQNPAKRLEIKRQMDVHKYERSALNSNIGSTKTVQPFGGGNIFTEHHGSKGTRAD